MKFLKILLCILTIVSLAFLASCAEAGGGYGGGYGGDYGGYYPSGDHDDGDSTVENGSSGGNGPQAGAMTASAWNDNENYALWQSLFMQDQNGLGKFVGFSGDNSWGFNSLHRVKVRVTDGGEGVSGAYVSLTDDNHYTAYKAVTDANGFAYLFTNLAEGTVTAQSGSYTGHSAFTKEQRDVVIELDGSAVKMNVIELMLVVDVTGSMGDEIQYLKTELADVIYRVAASNLQVQINLALLFYRDKSDLEEFVYYDFENVTESAGLNKQQTAISKQYAYGGGDYPEAVDEALEMAVSKDWIESATTKILFHVLDAPPHTGSEYQNRLVSATLKAAEKGIRICPILASGADTLTEYISRQIAIHTGGTFSFITDHSGIGNSHHDPEVPTITVEALNSLMVRLINGYHSGKFAPPVDYRQEYR